MQQAVSCNRHHSPRDPTEPGRNVELKHVGGSHKTALLIARSYQLSSRQQPLADKLFNGQKRDDIRLVGLDGYKDYSCPRPGRVEVYRTSLRESGQDHMPLDESRRLLECLP